MLEGKGIQKIRIMAIFLLPSLIGMFCFIILPILLSIGLSFTDWDLLSPIKWVGFENYFKIAKDPKFYKALKHTLQFIMGYLPSVVIIAFGIAALLNRKMKGINFFRAIYFLPVISSWVAVSVVWRWVFNAEYGLLNYFLSLVGVQGPAWLTDSKWALIAVIITSVWKDIGFVCVIFLAGLQEISDMYYEAAQIDGANGLQKTRYITLPLLSQTTFFIVVISLINSFQVFDQVWIMTAGGPAGATSVIVEQIYRNAFRYYKMGYASALSWVLFSIIFLVTFVQSKFKKRWDQ